MNHFTDLDGYNGIRASRDWRFLANQPPAGHPRGAYFTTLERNEPNLANKLRVPRRKLAYVFAFTDSTGLRPIEGGRGRFVFYSPDDYTVEQERQVDHGETGL